MPWVFNSAFLCATHAAPFAFSRRIFAVASVFAVTRDEFVSRSRAVAVFADADFHAAPRARSLASMLKFRFIAEMFAKRSPLYQAVLRQKAFFRV